MLPSWRCSTQMLQPWPMSAISTIRECRGLGMLTTPRHGRFYRAISRPAGDGGLPPLEAVDGSDIQKACGEFGVNLIGPLPAMS